MNEMRRAIGTGERLVVGSLGRLVAGEEQALLAEAKGCDLVEVRLDLSGGGDDWKGFAEKPLLFTARSPDEGGAKPWNARKRENHLLAVVDYAACVDVEVASIQEMGEIIRVAMERGIPWVGSFHDFEKLPPTRIMEEAAKRASEAGASIFKVAAHLDSPTDMARLAEFQMADHGIAVATMGMGSLAPVSRLLCAQCGSVLNYGYLGNEPTAPGQWDAGMLGRAIRKLTKFP